MSTIDLIAKIKKDSKKMTNSQRRQRLVDAHIINTSGEFDPKYFSSHTIKNSKVLRVKA